jgi:hypothetical protein
MSRPAEKSRLPGSLRKSETLADVQQIWSSMDITSPHLTGMALEDIYDVSAVTLNN